MQVCTIEVPVASVEYHPRIAYAAIFSTSERTHELCTISSLNYTVSDD